MRPKLLAAGAVLAVLAFLAWPAEEPALQTASLDGAESTSTSSAAPLLAVGLACASLALVLQAFRPEARSEGPRDAHDG